MAAEPLPQTSSTADARWPPAPTPAAGARRADRQGRVVQSMAHKVTRPCSRNGCPAPARASMVLDYAGRLVTLVPLLDRRDPRFLEVCPTHAEGMDVPRGWDLVDDRGEEPVGPTGPPTPEEMGSSTTVALLAAALRGAEQSSTSLGRDEDSATPVADRGGVSGPPTVEPDHPDQPDDVAVAPERHLPTGRIVAPRSTGTSERQLSLDEERVARSPRPVRAARDDRRPPATA